MAAQFDAANTKKEEIVETERKQNEKSDSSSVRLKCDYCSVECILPIDKWSVKCSCGELLLAPQKAGFRYARAICKASKIFNISLRKTIFPCECCFWEHIIGDTIEDTYSGQTVYSTELAYDAVEIGKLQLKEMEEKVKQLELANQLLEETNKSQKKEMAELKDTKEKAVQLAENAMTKLTDTAIIKATKMSG